MTPSPENTENPPDERRLEPPPVPLAPVFATPLLVPPDQLTIEFRPDEELIAVRWVGQCAFDRVREVYQRVGALLGRTRAQRILFDIREREIIGEDAFRWVTDQAFTALTEGQTGLLRLAYAAPEPVYVDFNDRNALDRTENGVRVGVFRTPASAIAWLLHS